jgi:hypothetical protein
MAYYKQQLWTESVSAVTATPSVELGTRRIVNGSEYVYAYNALTVADQRLIVRGATSGTGYSFSVTTTSGMGAPIMGIVENQTCAAASYCWLLTKGYTKAIPSGVSTLAVGGGLAPVRIVPCAEGKINIATGGTGTTGPTIGFLTTVISDVTDTSVAVYISTGF